MANKPKLAEGFYTFSRECDGEDIFSGVDRRSPKFNAVFMPGDIVFVNSRSQLMAYALGIPVVHHLDYCSIDCSGMGELIPATPQQVFDYFNNKVTCPLKGNVSFKEHGLLKVRTNKGDLEFNLSAEGS
jgi:hypothetical protein